MKELCVYTVMGYNVCKVLGFGVIGYLMLPVIFFVGIMLILGIVFLCALSYDKITAFLERRKRIKELRK